MGTLLLQFRDLRNHVMVYVVQTVMCEGMDHVIVAVVCTLCCGMVCVLQNVIFVAEAVLITS